QCHVEQKNHTHVRELFGYERYGDKVLVELMNDLYANEWSSLQNLWIPTFKMIRKTRVGAKYQREYGEPKTAYDRVMESKEVSLEVKEKLTELKKSQNPFQLMTSIQTKLARINKLREHAERNIG
ncbi:MAG: integrase, partial [Bdellovibrionales bacterium]